MKTTSQRFEFSDIYEYISVVESHICDSDTFIELDFVNNSALLSSLQKPNRLSILHHYIYRMICVYYSRHYRKESDCLDSDYASRLMESFNKYGIKHTSYRERATEHEDVEDFYLWFLENSEGFEHYWELLTDEIFHLVFANRRFLQQFNITLSRYLEENTGLLVPEITSRNGKIKRYTRLPEWLKKAIYFRDGGCCVICATDLTGLLKIDSKSNFDHIVPLARYGTNDPSNFQLLCSDCNSDKRDRNSNVGLLYTPWWQYVDA